MNNKILVLSNSFGGLHSFRKEVLLKLPIEWRCWKSCKKSVASQDKAKNCIIFVVEIDIKR